MSMVNDTIVTEVRVIKIDSYGWYIFYNKNWRIPLTHKCSFQNELESEKVNLRDEQFLIKVDDEKHRHNIIINTFLCCTWHPSCKPNDYLKITLMTVRKRSMVIYHAQYRYDINDKTVIKYQHKLQYKLQIWRIIRNILHS